MPWLLLLLLLLPYPFSLLPRQHQPPFFMSRLDTNLFNQRSAAAIVLYNFFMGDMSYV